MMKWWSFPLRHRRRYLAQRGICPYCGQPMPLNVRAPMRPNKDHVKPRALGGTGALRGNIVLAHEVCNTEKADRAPYACEVLFGLLTEEIRHVFYRNPQEARP